MSHKILAIDDEAAMLQLLERILSERAGCRVRTTANSLEAPDILERETFDLVITDLRMPGLSGLDVARFICERHRPEEVIILTAYGTLEAAKKAIELGVGAFLTKPIKRERLLVEVDRALERGKRRRMVEKLSKACGIEPYAEAEKAFREEYIIRLAQELGGDVGAVASRSGTDVTVVREILARRDENNG
jgi:DNA-binding NtrC family response regulator